MLLNYNVVATALIDVSVVQKLPEFVVSVSFLNHLDVVSVDHTIKLVV
ncbi:Uncharacterised protein [Staphylococcus aureus]|nr:Uncharacterised protein [Staphylococcus aureus]